MSSIRMLVCSNCMKCDVLLLINQSLIHKSCQGVILLIQLNKTNLSAIKGITSSKRTNFYCFCFVQISHGNQLQRYLVNPIHFCVFKIQHKILIRKLKISAQQSYSFRMATGNKLLPNYKTRTILQKLFQKQLLLKIWKTEVSYVNIN